MPSSILGLNHKTKLLSSRRTVCIICTPIFGAYGIRVTAVPFYANSSEQQIQYMINDAQIRFLFVGEQEQYDKAHRIFALCPSLERIIIFDSSVRISTHDPAALYFKDFLKLGENLPRQTEVEELYKQANMDDLADILYTSGTTGDSKGVMLTYSQYAAALKANNECVPVTDKDRVIDFLPFTHIFERAWSYLCLSEGAQLIINTYPQEIQESMREMRPTCMCSVPRFWEKVYIAVKAKMDDAGPIQKKLFYHALAVGKKRNIDYIANCKRPPLALELEYKIVNKTILSIVRKQLGLDNPNIFPTAGAYVSPEVEEFVHAIGINMVVGYGLTESLATVSCDHLDKSTAWVLWVVLSPASRSRSVRITRCSSRVLPSLRDIIIAIPPMPRHSIRMDSSIPVMPAI